MADRAILFGINNYESISDLNGCVNDVENIQRLLIETYGFEDQNIRPHLDADVTQDSIREGFDWMIEAARPGDRLVFHFSGHGSYIKSENDDEDVDELLCLYDMDWDTPSSYLIDDDLGALTRKVPAGVRLTVILDCCHAGTGTRAITANFQKARSITAKTRLMIVSDTAHHLPIAETSRTIRQLETGDREVMGLLRSYEARPVIARFVPPPERLQPKSRSVRPRQLALQMRSQLNHQLLASAADVETAADAFIAGSYHGAFSYYFCETVRNLGSQATVQQVFIETVKKIHTHGYGQTPQNEGPFADEPLFGGRATPTDDVTRPSTPPEHDDTFLEDQPLIGAVDAPSPSTITEWVRPSESQPLELLGNLLRVSEKLIDLAERQPARGIVTELAGRALSDECVVYVHGISQHRTGYSVPWYAAMQPHLRRALERHEVLWSHHTNPRSLRRVASEVEAAALARQLEQELEERMEQVERQIELSDGTKSVERLARPRGAGFAVDDFARYMASEETREAILAEFDRIVRPLLRSGRKMHIIGHSWGTVVAYEGLRRLDAESMSGRVANLFVVGSALSIRMVQANLFGRVRDGRRPTHVERMINLDAGGDVVGGYIGERFVVYREFLGLDPVGCAKIPFTGLALNPACAHSSYFRPANVEVNDRIFAKFIQGG